jgi:hypothetical protein
MCWVRRVKTLNKRFKCWVSHRNLDLGLAFELSINWVWSSCDFSRPILLVDETKQGDKIGVLRVSLAFEQRAIPLLRHGRITHPKGKCCWSGNWCIR